MAAHPIGIFDSGYGGLTVLKDILEQIPEYDYLYMGDNSRAPYGTRSYETVYRYTLECVEWFFSMGCPLVVLACNTASAKALRTIQQNDLPVIAPNRRVLGVIRPTSEIIGNYTKTGNIAVLATNGTVQSQSYPIEISKFFPNIAVFQEACPIWVPLIENNEHTGEGADYFIKKHLDAVFSRSPSIDTLLLACTHYPLLMNKIQQYIPEGVTILSQGKIVAASLKDYLLRHREISEKCTRGAERIFYTTDSTADFDNHARLFFGKDIKSLHLDLDKNP
ncbi:MAG: glutamate racemase [Chitinophagaceae bacterium]|nr:glutamate racemase [Chitinophagaceae bacterium]